MIYQRIVKLKDILIPKYHNSFNDIKHMIQIFTSGRAGTKSSRGAIKAVFKVVNDDNCSVVIIRKFHNKLKKTVYKEVLRAIKRLGLDKSDFKITVSPMEIKYKPNGNTIYFTGSDSIDDTKGMIDEEKSIKLVIIDEATEFFDKGEGEDEFNNIEATFVRGNDDEFVMEYYFNPPRNPKAPIMEWLNKMKKREDVLHIHTDYRDVPVSWLGKKLIQTAEMMKRLDKKMYNWIWLGLCTGLDDLVYYMFNENNHIKEPTEEELKRLRMVGICIDYGQMNATTYECFGIDFFERKIRGIDEYYHSGRDTGHQKSPSEYAKDFKEFVENIEYKTDSKVTFAVIDPSAVGLAEEIKRVCPSIKFIKADNTVIKGINRVQKLLSFLVLKLSPKQKNAINEFQLYGWDMDQVEKGNEVPIKRNDHCMDAIRYYVMYVWKHISRMLPYLKEEKDETK